MITILLTPDERLFLTYMLNYELYMSVGAILDNESFSRNERMTRIVNQTDMIFQLRTLVAAGKPNEEDTCYFTDIGFAYLQALVENSGRIPIPPSIQDMYARIKDGLAFKFQDFNDLEVAVSIKDVN